MCKAMVLSMTAGVYTLNESTRRQVGEWLPHIRSPRLTAVEGQLACAKRVSVARVNRGELPPTASCLSATTDAHAWSHQINISA
jgi:hypothetical protein